MFDFLAEAFVALCFIVAVWALWKMCCTRDGL